MAVRRAFQGTVPALKPGIKVGGVCDGSRDFIENRLALFKELYAEQEERKKELPRNPIVITLPDGSEKPGTSNETTPLMIAQSISVGLAKAAIVAKVVWADKNAVQSATQCANTEDVEGQSDDGAVEEDDDADHKDYQLWDMTRPLPASCTLAFLKFEDKEAKGVFWHSSGHLLGLVAEQLYGAQVTIGPALQKGFYYDFYLGDRPALTQDSYEDIKKKAAEFHTQDLPFHRLEVSKEDALVMFQDNPFKVALISAKVPEGGKTSVYCCGPFVDLCMGPHIPNLNYIKAFQVEKHSSAYWLGNCEGDSLQRVYGITFPDAKMMKEHIRLVEEAKKRDHRLLGQQLDLFFFEPAYAAGSAFWLPKGAKVYNKLVELMRAEYLARGFSEVHSPNLFSCDIFRVSGHLQNYKDCMFLLDVEGKDWGLKPMNCPGHCVMFKHMAPSYRQLPIRMADFGVLHRNEFSGSLSGLTRVRRFQQDDAHIFCRMDQVESEVSAALDFLFFIYKLFGFTFELHLSTRPKKALGTVELWDKAETQLRNSLNQCGMPWKLNKGDGAFYGPKIDIKLHDALERQHQCGTIQLDFQLPLRFDLQYKSNEDGTATAVQESDECKQADQPPASTEQPTQQVLRNVDGSLETEVKPGFGRPVMVHRAILGSIERMSAVILEHTGGRLPFWLSPRQAIVCPISEKNLPYAQYVTKVLRDRGFDVEVDASNNTINKKIREAQVHQWNYILVVGAQEEEERCVMVRQREDPKNQVKMALPQLIEMFGDLRDIAKRRPAADIPPFVPPQ